MIDLHAEFVGGSMHGQRGPVNPVTQKYIELIIATGSSANEGCYGHCYHIETYSVRQEENDGHCVCRLMASLPFRPNAVLPRHLRKRKEAHEAAKKLNNPVRRYRTSRIATAPKNDNSGTRGLARFVGQYDTDHGGLKQPKGLKEKGTP